MRIAYVSDSIYPYNKGGKEKRLYEISTRLAKMGHDVHIYTMHWWNEAEKHKTENGLNLHAICDYMPMYKNDMRSLKEGVLFGIATLKLIKEDFEVIDVDHMPFFPVFGVWLVCKLRGKKFFGTWHERLTTKEWIGYMGYKGYVASVIERMTISLPDVISAASEHTKRKLLSKNRRLKNIETVESGIDLDIINSSAPTKENIDVLYVGRLVKDKNVDKLIDAVYLLSRDSKNIRCVIVGSGIEKDNLAKKIRKYELGKNVILTGLLPESKDVYSYMKKAKVFVLPSVREGFGIVALEALACKTPVITINSPHNAAKDLIDCNVNGSIVDLNAKDIASAIRYWVEKDTKVEPVRIEDMSWDNIATKQEKVYVS